jgi:hypothetical protein
VDWAFILPILCDFLEIPFEPDMLGFNKKDLTNFDAIHLSMERISKPFDATEVGRWKRDLTEEQVTESVKSAEPAMSEFGYV